jgi:hypothetical protein
MKNTRQAMWQVVRMRGVLSVSDLQEIAEVSKSYAVTFLNLLAKNGIAKKLASGKYRLRINTVELPFEVSLHYAQKALPLVKTDRPEDIIWERIVALSKDGKEFLHEDIAGSPVLSTQLRRYMSALINAGYIKKRYKKGKKRNGNGDGRARYRLVKNTGNHAPILGRTVFLWDRNTDTVWTKTPDNTKYLKSHASSLRSRFGGVGKAQRR